RVQLSTNPFLSSLPFTWLFSFIHTLLFLPLPPMSHDDFPYQGSYSVDLSSVTALAFLVWDIVITIDQEVDAVWLYVHP
ncbi:hypothetical protein F5148DRAFT_657924, partial [Russula earlei]